MAILVEVKSGTGDDPHRARHTHQGHAQVARNSLGLRAKLPAHSREQNQ